MKYDDIYLHAYATMRELKAGLARYFAFYNTLRPHQSLEDRTPDAVYFGSGDMKQVA